MRSAANKEERRLRKLLETYSNIPKQQFMFHVRTSSPLYPLNKAATKQVRNLWPGRATNVTLPHLGRLDRWHKVYFPHHFYHLNNLGYCIRGLTLGHPRVSDNQWIVTAPVIIHDYSLCEAETVEGRYILGEEVIPIPKNIWQKFPLPRSKDNG